MPGLPDPAGGEVRCISCAAPLSRPAPNACASTTATSTSAAATSTATSTAAAESANFHTALPAEVAFEAFDHELAQDLAAARAAIASVRRTTGMGPVANSLSHSPAMTRLDGAHSGPPAWHATTADTQRGSRRKRSRSTDARATRRRAEEPTLREEVPPEVTGGGNWISWTLVAVGIASFLAGGVLLGWSYLGDRPDLARLGLPLVLAGQAGLIVGLMLQLESLWQSTQQATQTLSSLDEEVAEMKQTTALLGTTAATPADRCQSHLEGGASPHILLANMKGQLDLLAMRLGK